MFLKFFVECRRIHASRYAPRLSLLLSSAAQAIVGADHDVTHRVEGKFFPRESTPSRYSAQRIWWWQRDNMIPTGQEHDSGIERKNGRDPIRVNAKCAVGRREMKIQKVT